MTTELQEALLYLEDWSSETDDPEEAKHATTILKAATNYAKLEPLLTELVEARELANEGRWSKQMIKNRWVLDDGDWEICRMSSKDSQNANSDFITKAANLTPQIKSIIGEK